MSHRLLTSLGYWAFEPIPLEEIFERLIQGLAENLPEKVIRLYYAPPDGPLDLITSTPPIAPKDPLNPEIIRACQQGGQQGWFLEEDAVPSHPELSQPSIRRQWGMVFGLIPQAWGILLVQQPQDDSQPWTVPLQGFLQGIALQLTVLLQQRALASHFLPPRPPDSQILEGILLRSDTRLRAILNHSPLIVYVLDREGYFVLSEGLGLERLGLKPGQVVGQSALNLYKDNPETIAALRDALQGKPRSWTAHINGNVYDCRVTLLRNHEGEVDGLIGVSTDITDLMQAQTALDHLFLGTATVTGQDFFIALAKYLALALDAQYAMINELQGDHFQTIAFWANGEVQDNITYGVVDAPGCSRVLAQKEYLYVPQMGEERNCPLLKPLGVTTYLGTPLKDPEGNILGTLCILNDHPLKDPEQAQRILEIFAARVGAELNRIQVERALANLNAELEIRVQERTQLLEQSQQRFQRLVENVPGAVYQFKLSATGESQVLYISDYITYLLGIAAADIMANSEVILSRIHPNDQSSFEQSIQDSYDHQSRWNWDGRFLHQDGGYRWLRGIAHPTAQLDQSMIWDGILVDITDRKAAEANMNLALKKQRELNEIKSQLITTMSHEFRTPLAVIGSSASILRSFSHQLPEEKKQRHLKTIETYIQHTSQLLEDVLFLNRVNAGRLSFQPTRINLAKFFTDLITEAYLSHGEYPMQFQAELISTVPHCTIQITLPSERNFLDEKTFQEEEWGEVDVKLLRQIFLNLIDNAIKYSTSDRYPIEVNLKLTTNTIILYIGDRGIGIPLEDQEHLFEPFHRGKNVGERSGTGLGLSVVKNCIDLHRGEIKISSDPHGTVFTVILPRHQTYLAVTPE